MMDESMPTVGGDRPTRRSERIDEACDRFEAAWRTGVAPRIEDFLAEVEAGDRAALLRELLVLERELRGKRGERPAAQDYLERFPEHPEVARAVFGVAPRAGAGAAARPESDAGRNLLFGVLALQNNFIGRDDLLAAFAAWVADKARSLAQLLVDRGALDAARRALLEALVAEHLKQHGGDTEASLAAVSSLGSVREDLERLDDPGLQASLAAASRTAADSGATATYAPSSRQAGERFRILRFHREGGLGRVYVARDEELGREVAIKEIRPDKVAEADLCGRFILEAEINGGLEHPGIVPVYSLGSYDDGRPFYAMRFVEGDSLKEAIESYHNEHPQPDPSAVEFRKLLGRFIDVCEAIAFAHSKGVLHRDLKPHNVMLGRFGETLLIDWGLAKATGRREPVGTGAAGEATLVPPSGSGHAPTLGVLGSPPYMSPEQAAGSVDALGPATDVYGLGAILFALLTGEPPVQGGAIEDVLDRARRGAIRPPRSLNPHIPRALEAVCLKALARTPQDRYPSARALADDTERWLADQPVTAWREPLSIRARRWMRRNRTGVTGAVAALLVAFVGLAAVAGVQARANVRLKRANDETNIALRQSQEARKHAEAVTGFLVDALRSPDPWQSGRDVKVADILDRAAVKLNEQSFSGSLATRGTLLHVLGVTYLGLGRYDQAVTLLSGARAAREAALGRNHPDVLASRNSLANAYADVGRLSEAIALHESTLKLRETTLGPRHPDTLASVNNLANAYEDAGRFPEAIALHEATLKLREATLRPDDGDTLTSRNNLAEAYRAAGRLADAIALHKSNLETREATRGADHPDTLMSRNNLASAYHDAGRSPDAIPLFETNLKMRESKLGPNHPETLMSRNNLASAYLQVGRLSEATVLYESTLAATESMRGIDHPATLICRANLAEAYRGLGRLSEAIALDKVTVKMRASKLGPDHADTLTSRTNLAVCYADAGRLSEAITLHESTLKRFEATLSLDHPYTLDSRANVASAYQSLGRWAEAELLYRDTLARRRMAVKPGSLSLAGDLMRLARNLLAQSRSSEAESLLRECLKISQEEAPEDWARYDAMSLLGGSLSGQRRYAEAEPLVVQGYEGLKLPEATIPVPERFRLREAAVRVVHLYEEWGKLEQAAAWKLKLGLTDLPTNVFARPTAR